MKILITGGTGYVGTILADHLHRAGHELTLLARKTQPALGEWARRFQVCYGDVADAAAIEGICAGQDVVIHLASLNEIDSASHPRDALLVNSFGTRNMLEEAHRAGVGRFFYLSTFHVYGDHSGLISEDAAPRPMNDYASTHLFSEYYALQFARAKGLPASILRLSNGYGAPVAVPVGRWTLLVNDLCKLAREKRKLVLKSSGLHKRDFVWLPDLAQAIELLMKRSPEEVARQVYNVAYGESRAIYDVALLVQSVYREKYGEGIPLERPAPAPNESHPVPTVDIAKLRRFGYQPHDRLREEVFRIFELLDA